jgi:DNA modification methylase
MSTIEMGRRRPGEVRDAILDFLRERRTPATVSEIEEAVAKAFGGLVSASSVRSYLRLNTPTLFTRQKQGVYGLPRVSQVDDSGRGRPRPVREVVAGSAVLFHGDCVDWLADQPERSIHAVVTDPPYGLVEYSESEQDKLRKGRGGVWRIPPSFDGHRRSPLPRFTVLDHSQREGLREFFARWAEALLPVLVPGAHVIVASNPLLSYLVAHAVVSAGFERRGEIIRLTMTMRGGDRPKNAHQEFSGVSVMPRSMWEPWLLFRKPVEGRVQDNLRRWKTGGLRRPGADQPFGDVIRSSPTHASERAIAPHPSLKPQRFLRQLVRAVLPLGEGVVLDPFAGSGSTLAACEALGYASVGVEIDAAYVSLARKAIPRLSALSIPDHALYTQP